MLRAERPLELDARFTFDSFVVGTANRLASAAARRVGELPGSAYNPLFLYSASGLGKTHLLTAIGHHASRLHPNLVVVYDTLEHFTEEALSAIERGEREDFRHRLREIGLLMLDDVQFLAGRRGVQDELLLALDAVSARSGQLVLASDRPPAEINGLDDRLLSRFAGGLVADIGAPEYETRVAIVNRKADEHGHKLGSGVAEALARLSFANVRELQGGLNRLIAIQELDGRSVKADEIAAMFGQARTHADFSAFFSEIVETVDAVVKNVAHDQRIAEAIQRFEAEGYATRRLEAALDASASESEIDLLLQQYEQDVDRLRSLKQEIAQLDANDPALGDKDLFRNPDRVADAESVATEARERSKPLPQAPAEFTFGTLTMGDSFAVKAARAIVEKPGQQYNPLFFHGATGSGKTTLLAAIANEFAARYPAVPVAFVKGHNFANELINALERNAAESWRHRYRRAGLFVVDDLDALVDTERAQDELFHLFEDLRRSRAQLVFGASKPAGALNGLENRLCTRLESGLVVELPGFGSASAPATHETRNQTPAAWVQNMNLAQQSISEPIFDSFFLSREKVIWNWPYLEDCLFEELQ